MTGLHIVLIYLALMVAAALVKHFRAKAEASELEAAATPASAKAETSRAAVAGTSVAAFSADPEGSTAKNASGNTALDEYRTAEELKRAASSPNDAEDGDLILIGAPVSEFDED